MDNLEKPSKSVNNYFLNATVRQDVLDLMPEKLETVLELGCGIGVTGMEIYKQKGIKPVGIDISKEAITVAQEKGCYDKLLVVNLDENPLPPEIANQTFDCIIYPDILKHLKDPWSIVNTHKNLLSNNGMMIASIPNIRHYSLVKDLVFKGNWSYTEMGIMDRTHLRFFTKKTMVSLFANLGLEVKHIGNTGLCGPNWLKKINKLNSKYFEEFLVIQYLICAVKNN